MSETYKNSPKRKLWARGYYKNYFSIPENAEKNRERTRKRYWIEKIIITEGIYKNEIEFLNSLSSLELKELYAKITSE
ncbi:MAG: hypothetical protein PHU45_02755 [Bacilli bacterium]|nr:hypothetical protein [Bacilli bacterium]